jgi:hypothetical protein
MVSPAAARPSSPPPSPPSRPVPRPPSPAPAPAAPVLFTAGSSSAAPPRPAPRSGFLASQLAAPASAASAAAPQDWRDNLPSLRVLMIGSGVPTSDQQRLMHSQRELKVATEEGGRLRTMARRGLLLGKSVPPEMASRKHVLSADGVLPDSQGRDCRAETERLVQAILNHTPKLQRSEVRYGLLKAFGSEAFVRAFVDFAGLPASASQLKYKFHEALGAHPELRAVLDYAWASPAPSPSAADLRAGDPACRLGLMKTQNMQEKELRAVHEKVLAEREHALLERKNLAGLHASKFEALPDFLDCSPAPAPSDGRANLLADKVVGQHGLIAALKECDTLHVLSRALASPDVPEETKAEIKVLMHPFTSHNTFLNPAQALAVKKEIAHRLYGTPNPDRPAHKDPFLDGAAHSRRHSPEMLINDITEWMRSWSEPAPTAPQAVPSASGAGPSDPRRRPPTFTQPRHPSSMSHMVFDHGVTHGDSGSWGGGGDSGGGGD